jgi:hypothetical protein
MMMQKYRVTAISGLFLSAIAVTGIPQAAIAAEEEGSGEYRPPVCEPAITTGFTRCNYEGGDNYIGYLENGVPNGRGTYVYGTGDRYEGEFLDGRPSGRGRFVKEDDSRYEGIFANGVIIDGAAIFPNGDRYDGAFQVVQNVESGEISSQPGGLGKLTFVNGNRYEGEFYAGQPFGRGMFVHRDGSYCTGQFFNQAFDGKGACAFSNGARYEGEWRGAVPHGTGTLVRRDGSTFTGLFRDGQPLPLVPGADKK